MGLLERAIGIAEELAPAWAMKRAQAKHAAALLNQGYGYHGASSTKKSLKGWVTSTGGPDADIVDNIDKLRERSRDLCMGEGLAIGALRTLRINEVGSGLRLNAQIDAEYLGFSDEQAQAWETSVEREFALWAESKMCDAARLLNFGQLQALARLSQLMSGDVFALLPSIERPGDRYSLRVRLLEADRVCDPLVRQVGVDILGGVEVDELGAPVAYHVSSVHPGDRISGRLALASQQKWTRVPAFDAEGMPIVLHLMEMERPGQRRGVPLLAPVIEKVKQLSRYSEAEITAAVVSGFFTAAITSQTPQTPLGMAVPEAEQVDKEDDTSYELGPGALIGLDPGEKLEAVNPGRPNAGFEPFVVAVCRQIGAGLGIPYEVLVKQFMSSYSASRAALLEFWKHINVNRAWLAAGFCQPIYQAWLTEAVARGYVAAPGFFTDPLSRAAWCGAEWIGPTQGQLDPTKEVEAAARRVAEGFSTRTRETRELTGGDWWAFNRLRGREEQARKDAGLDTAPAAAQPTQVQPTSQEAA